MTQLEKNNIKTCYDVCENLYAQKFNAKYVFDVVLMNEDPCIHPADFPNEIESDGPLLLHEMGVPLPTYVYSPQQEKKSMKVSITCPVCKRNYKEAERRVKKDIQKFMADLSQCDLPEGVCV